MSFPCDWTFPWVPLLIFLTLWLWPWSLYPFFKKFYLVNNFWTVLELWYFTWVFLVIRPFSEYHYLWHCDLDLGDQFFLKTLTLIITFEKWVLYCTWVFLVIRPFCGYHFFDPVTLTLEVDLLFKNINFVYSNVIVRARALICHLSISSNTIFPWKPIFLTLWHCPCNLAYVLNTLDFYITFEYTCIFMF